MIEVFKIVKEFEDVDRDKFFTVLPSTLLQMPNFCGNMQKFHYLGNSISLGLVWMIPIHCLTPETPTFVQESGTYLLYKPSYSQIQFYAQIVNFSLPWQQGRSWVILNAPWNRPTSKTSSLVQEYKWLKEPFYTLYYRYHDYQYE